MEGSEVSGAPRSDVVWWSKPRCQDTGGTVHKKRLFPTLTQSRGHRQPPKCSPESEHSHPCKSMFFFSCSFEHGREGCPLKVHACGPFPDDLFKFQMFCLSVSILWTPGEVHGVVRGGKTKPSKTGLSKKKKTVKNHDFQIWRLVMPKTHVGSRDRNFERSLYALDMSRITSP